MEISILQEDNIESNDIEREIQEECIVCFEPFDVNISRMKKYEFNHCTPVSLHTKCFIQWVSENRNSCIVCRELITDGPEYYNISLLVRLYSFIREQNNMQEFIHLRQNDDVLCKSKRVVIIAFFLVLVFIATLPLYK